MSGEEMHIPSPQIEQPSGGTSGHDGAGAGVGSGSTTGGAPQSQIVVMIFGKRGHDAKGIDPPNPALSRRPHGTDG